MMAALLLPGALLAASVEFKDTYRAKLKYKGKATRRLNVQLVNLRTDEIPQEKQRSRLAVDIYLESKDPDDGSLEKGEIQTEYKLYEGSTRLVEQVAKEKTTFKVDSEARKALQLRLRMITPFIHLVRTRHKEPGRYNVKLPGESSTTSLEVSYEGESAVVTDTQTGKVISRIDLVQGGSDVYPRVSRFWLGVMDTADEYMDAVFLRSGGETHVRDAGPVSGSPPEATPAPETVVVPVSTPGAAFIPPIAATPAWTPTPTPVVTPAQTTVATPVATPVAKGPLLLELRPGVDRQVALLVKDPGGVVCSPEEPRPRWGSSPAEDPVHSSETELQKIVVESLGKEGLYLVWVENRAKAGQAVEVQLRIRGSNGKEFEARSLLAPGQVWSPCGIRKRAGDPVAEVIPRK